MRIKKYRAKDMKEALVRIKQDFGSEAVILHSRNVIVGGIFGFFGRQMVEVTAGTEINLLEDKVPKRKPKEFNVDKNVTGIKTYQNVQKKIDIKDDLPAVPTEKREIVVEKSKEPSVKVLDIDDSCPVVLSGGKQVEELSDKVARVEDHLDDLSNGLKVVVNNIKAINMKHFNSNLVGIFEYLFSVGFTEELATELIDKMEEEMSGKEIKDKDKVFDFLFEEITKKINVGGAIRPIEGDGPIKVAFIGATGVGKTTTIAKLAANFSLIQKKNIALVTVDTYRIAAIEQLKTYASIIGVPIDVVFTPEELKDVLAQHSDKDIILIDTAGRSPKNSEQIKELKKFVDAGGDDLHKYLVLSATSKQEDIEDAITKFSCIKTNNIIFTKLDETNSYGTIINVLDKHNKELSYITAGQNVPDDLEVADAADIIKKVLRKAEMNI